MAILRTFCPCCCSVLISFLSAEQNFVVGRLNTRESWRTAKQGIIFINQPHGWIHFTHGNSLDTAVITRAYPHRREVEGRRHAEADEDVGGVRACGVGVGSWAERGGTELECETDVCVDRHRP